MNLEPQRVIGDLAQFARLTSDERGAQRVCWSPVWRTGREWLARRLAQLPVDVQLDPAGNLWATLPGHGPQSVLVGSHTDSVPDGGAFDGVLGVLAALEIMRATAASGETPRLGLKLVDWADEEGSRFGHSLLGSSAATGSLDVDAVLALRDDQGRTCADVLAEHGVDLRRPCGAQLQDVVAALELHIEQGPVLEEAGAALGVVTGTLAVARQALSLAGQSAHAGSTPMRSRHDPLLAAAVAIVGMREAALESPDARATVGALAVRPAIATAIAAEARLTVDLRAPGDEALQALLARVRALVGAASAAEGVTASWEGLWAIPAVEFDRGLGELLARTCEGAPPRLPSGALHDSANLARCGIPAAMLFVRSRAGISHNALEYSSDADIFAGVASLGAATAELLGTTCACAPASPGTSN